jgi:hypothetical protein
MLADFTIHIHDARKPMAVRVKVHDSPAALQRACAKYAKHDPRAPKGDTDFSGVLGICHRFHMMNDPLVALIRLAPPHIGAAMVAHECGHAAVWLWEIENKFKHNLHCSNDEWFCWILGELVRRVTNKLHEKGVYK